MKEAYNSPVGINTKSENDTIMNSELQQWIIEDDNRVIPPEKKEIKAIKYSYKKTSGKCKICNKKKSKFKCIKCGKSVCSSCYFNLVSLCKQCIPQETVDRWEDKPPNWEKILGVEWIE